MRSNALISIGILLFAGCTEQSSQLQALAAAAEMKATEATLDATRLRGDNQKLQSEIDRLQSELETAQSSGGGGGATSGPAVTLPTPEVTEELEFALFKDTKEFKATFESVLAGYTNIRFVSAPSIEVAEQVATPYSMALGLLATDPKGQPVFAEFKAKADWEGNWNFPDMETILKGVRIGDPVATPEVAATPADTGSSGTPSTDVADNSGSTSGTNPGTGNPTPKPGDTPKQKDPPKQSTQPSFLQGKQLQGSAKVDWNRTVD